MSDAEIDPWDESEDASAQDEAIDRAWLALDDHDAERAMQELEALDPDWPERWIPEALACIELDDFGQARRLLARVREFEDVSEHPDYLWAQGQLALREWRIDEARATLEKLEGLEPSAGLYERLALCADLVGDAARSDELMRRSVELATPGSAPFPHLTPDEFEDVVETAIEALPKEFHGPLETTEIVVEGVPGEWMIDPARPHETPPDMLGLFVGPSELERTEGDASLMPRRIFLFQRNLERACTNRDELVHEIRVTLFHEIGHMLGFDEGGVADLGLA